MGNKSNRCGAIMKDTGQINDPSPKQVKAFDRNGDGKVMSSEIKATLPDYGKPREAMAKDMSSSGVLYKKYCRK